MKQKYDSILSESTQSSYLTTNIINNFYSCMGINYNLLIYYNNKIKYTS